MSQTQHKFDLLLHTLINLLVYWELVASGSKWVNSILNIIEVNSLRLEGLRIIFIRIKINKI